MNIITDMIKHRNTASLSNGTISGALIWFHTNASCMVKSSLAPWNASGRMVLEEKRSIGTVRFDQAWCQKNNKRELTSEEWEAKLARPSSTRWEWWIEKGLKESLGWNIYVFFLLVIVILLLGHAKQRKQSWNVSYSSTYTPPQRN